MVKIDHLNAYSRPYPVYVVQRYGKRTTWYYYSTLNEAIKKYDELCRNKNYYGIDLIKLNPAGSGKRRNEIYTTGSGEHYRNVAKRRY